jgi:3-oxoacyl-[acyl-carrier-protein] synthase II
MTAGKSPTRVVVTGVGVISPIGIGNERFWSSLASGRSGIDRLLSVPSQGLLSKVAAEVRDFNPLDYVYEKKFLKVMSRDIQLGVSAASLAMQDSGLKAGDIDPDRLGVEFGAGHISFTPEELSDAARDYADPSNREGYTRWGERNLNKIAPLWLLRQLPNMPACHVAIEHDARGPNNTITSAESSALLALQEGMRVINRGQADAMIVGAASSTIDPIDLARLSVYENLSPNDDPLLASRPFDRKRDGMVAGEGSAVFVIESYEHARARGADIYCEILGVAAGADGRIDNPSQAGTGLVNAIETVLSRSNIRPGELGHINAHGKSTRRDDYVEAQAYHRALGDAADSIPVTALSSYFGHFDAGSGAVKLAGSILALRHGELPRTLNYDYPDPLCRLPVAREPMRLRSSVGMSVSRTAMGQSTAAVFRAV